MAPRACAFARHRKRGSRKWCSREVAGERER
ncbi:hypothetical protein chiPu_0024882, partial [Chiloscyllium punctatum]|nr:hypothetical protein [Chiloscyllium punctatum]